MSGYSISDRVKGFLDNPPASHCVLTKFLTLSDQMIAKSIIKGNAQYQLFGGYEDAEKKRLVMFEQHDFNITCFQIKSNEQYLTLTHQNILGTLMSLSIEIDAIGDIIAEEGIFFVISELKDFVILHFSSISNVPITLDIITDVQISKTVKLSEESCSVSSLRLDALVSKLTKMSRLEASTLINNDFVKVNQVVVHKSTKMINENDVISIRKFGRFLIGDTSSFSKKGKIIVKYGKYL